MGESVRIIKKYQNRKLYDTQDSCYVTLDGIAKMIREGEEIVVIDNNSKADVTALILTQVLYEQEKTHQSVLPVETLKNIVRSGSNNLYEFLTKYILGTLTTEIQTAIDLKLHIERLTAKGDISTEEALSLVRHIETTANTHQGALDKRIDQRLNEILATETMTSNPAEFQHLTSRLTTLENRAS